MRRRPDAPRLIEWTGERCVPWAPVPQVIYEHLHRYAWASQLVDGNDVLDLGSGEGFGSAMLADRARSVHGIDVDATTVQHATLNYGGDQLTYSVDDATKLSGLDDDRFDVAVAFEVLEHVEDHDALLGAVRRVLRPGGVLLISTPNRVLYTEEAEHENPFHVHELDQDEFAAVLGEHFTNARLFSQQAQTGSRIESIDDADGSGNLTVRVERDGDDWRLAPPPPPFYMIAVASDDALPDLPAQSTLVDHGLELALQAMRDTDAREHDGRVAAEQALEAERADRAGDAVRIAAEYAVRVHAVEALRDQLEAEVASLRAELDARSSDLATIEQSVSWEIFDKLRGRYREAFPPDSFLRRSVGAVLRRVGAGKG